jgi:hypothetical protein
VHTEWARCLNQPWCGLTYQTWFNASAACVEVQQFRAIGSRSRLTTSKKVAACLLAEMYAQNGVLEQPGSKFKDVEFHYVVIHNKDV